MFALAFALGGCLSPATSECSNGALCPGGLRCAETGGGAICVPVKCGDGNVDPGEACDDGNNVSGDGCEADCTLPPSCGNGVVDPGEDCDDGNDVPGDGCENCRFPIYPPARSGHRLVYDTARGHILLAGGRDARGLGLYDLWSWDGLHWTQLATAHAPMLTESAIAYDEARGTLLVFGGFDVMFQARNETWQWDGADWHELTPATRPPRDGNLTLVYDPVRDRMVLGGGGGAETWEWDGNDWTQRLVSGAPPFSQQLAAYDAAARRILVVAGDSDWAWDGVDWTSLGPDGLPGLNGAAIASDRRRERVLLFGGAEPSGMVQNRTWEWTVAWSERTPATSPPPRANHAMAYDALRDTIVMFGGTAPCGNGSCPLDDTWEWDGTTWVRRR